MINNSNIGKNTVLWRYMDFDALLEILTQRRIVFTRIDQFDDKFECMSVNENADLLLVEKLRKTTNILSWHKNRYESEAMWRLYSNYYKNAVAIKTTVNTLHEIFDDTFSIESVQYIDYKETEPDENMLYLYKRKSFEYENEIRVIHSAKKEAPYRLNVPLDEEKLHKLIKIIYISPYARFDFNIVVKSILDKYGFDKTQIEYSNEFMGGLRY